MGQAKKRGTQAERIAQAHDAARRRAQIAEAVRQAKWEAKTDDERAEITKVAEERHERMSRSRSTAFMRPLLALSLAGGMGGLPGIGAGSRGGRSGYRGSNRKGWS